MLGRFTALLIGSLRNLLSNFWIQIIYNRLPRLYQSSGAPRQVKNVSHASSKCVHELCNWACAARVHICLIVSDLQSWSRIRRPAHMYVVSINVHVELYIYIADHDHDAPVGTTRALKFKIYIDLDRYTAAGGGGGGRRSTHRCCCCSVAVVGIIIGTSTASVTLLLPSLPSHTSR